MKFKTLTLENFRQFIGTQTIHFSTDSEKNTTLILGKNGNGKTGIFRAIMFALYGDQSLSQDQKQDNNELVNWQILQEKEGQSIFATVTLTFEHLGVPYELTRRTAAKQENGRYQEVPIPRGNTLPALELSYLSDSMEQKNITEENEIQRKIEEILPKNMSEFFFFDGEQRSSLLDDTKTQTKREQRNNIKQEIYKILQLDPMEKAQKELQELEREYRKKLGDTASSQKIKEKGEELEQLENTATKYREELEEIEQIIQAAKEEERNSQEALNANQEAEYVQRELKDKKQIYQERVQQKTNLLNQTKNMSQSFGELLLLSVVKPDYDMIHDLLSTQEHRISVDVLQDSLSHHQCELCQQSLGEKEITIIQQLIQKYKIQESTEIMQKIVYRYKETESKEQQTKENIQSYFKELSTIDAKIREAKEEVEQVQEKFDSLDFNSSQLEKIRETLTRAKHTVEEEQAHYQKLSYELEMLENKQIPTLKKEYEALLAQDKKSDKLRRMLNKVELYKEAIDQILKEYRVLVTEELSTKVTALYKELISKKDRDKVSKIEITSDFDIHFYNQYQQEVLQDNSQGQKQMLSIAFILSLAEYAAKGRDELSFPLLIDTPFGRLDQENRRNLIENIPNLTAQWILLVTDSELSAYEIDYFAASNRVGAQYELENDQRGTIIEEKVSVSELNRGEA